MTTDDLENALAFADARQHEGDMRVIVHQAKGACRTLAAEVRRLRKVLLAQAELMQHEADDAIGEGRIGDAEFCGMCAAKCRDAAKGTQVEERRASE
jgi:hypothetical protein